MAKTKNLQWGSANRPKISNKLGVPHPTEGSDGDIQVRQTNLGAKLFARIGGQWNSTFLSTETKGLENKLTVGRLDLSDKIVLKRPEASIAIGNENSTAGTNNVSIGAKAGKGLLSGAADNICIGTNAGQTVTTGDKNIMIGTLTGDGASNDVTAGSRNIMIGYGSSPSGNNSDEIVIGGLDIRGTITTGNGDGTATISCPSGLFIGDSGYATGFRIVNRYDTDTGFYQGAHLDRFYCIAGDEIVWQAHESGSKATLKVHGYLDLLEKSADPNEPSEGHTIIWMSDGTEKGDDGDVLIASKAGGTTNYTTLFDHSSGTSW